MLIMHQLLSPCIHNVMLREITILRDAKENSMCYWMQLWTTSLMSQLRNMLIDLLLLEGNQ